MIDGIFEIAMLLCFAAAWPLSIMKSWKYRTAKGKSLMFLLILIFGYILGIINKFVTGDVNYVLAFYLFNIVLVAIDTALTIRNQRLDRIGDEESYAGGAV